jgi:uncharacterized protein
MAGSWRAPRLGTTLAAVATVLLLAASVTRAAEPEFPALTGHVVDSADILSPSVREQLTQMLAGQERSTGQQIVVVALKSLQGFTIEEFGYELGRHWGIGQSGQNNGAVLIVAPNERKVRIEVGFGLEDRLTDAQSRTIIESVILPRFRQGAFGAGTLEGAAAILRVLGGGQALTGNAPTVSPGQGVDQRVVVPDVVVLFMAFLGGFVMLLSIRGIFAHQPRRTPTSRNEDWGEVPSGGGSSGGVGFSGGGGSFGGGGASGSW